MGLFMVKNMKHLLLHLFITSESLKKDASEAPFLVDNKNDLSLSPRSFPLNTAKFEVGD